MDSISFRQLIRPSEDLISTDWRDMTGGPPVIGVLREYWPDDVLGLALQDAENQRFGLVTWWIQGDIAEIVSLHAVPQGVGIGTQLMDFAEAGLNRRGVQEVVLATTNDNLAALRFYVKRGWRLVEVHLDALDRVREAKPAVPRHGANGIPLRDMWELRKDI